MRKNLVVKICAVSLALVLMLLSLASCGGLAGGADGEIKKLSFSEANSVEQMKKLDGQKVSIIGYMSTLSPVNGDPCLECEHCRLISAEEAEVHGFEDKRVFEGCMPVEVMARRGQDTLRYGPLKPVGLTDPATGKEPYAVVQLRQDNAAKSVYNLVGFQTHLKFGEQKRVFSMIPALKNAEFVRYGVMHQNTFLQSPKLLDRFYADRRNPLVAFAGQMTGVEGYVESAASGYLASVAMAAKVLGKEIPDFPKETAIGALGLYISDGRIENFQPMNVNFSIIPPLEKRIKKKAEKNLAIANRSLEIIDKLIAEGV